MASIGTAEEVVTIGVDPHPGSHTATALDERGRELGTVSVESREDAGRRLLLWAGPFERRRWAIEGAGNRFVRRVVLELITAGEEVYSIPPSLTSQYRSRRGVKKDDVIDAANAARALQANADLPRYEPAEHEAHLKAVSRTYQRISTELKRLRMMRKAAEDEVVLAALEPAIAAMSEALETLRSELDSVTAAVAAELRKRQGIGPVVAATVLAEVGDIARFPDRDHLAAYGGAAPMPWNSGAHTTHRLNPGGNRRLNWAAHIIVRTRLRLDERTQAFRDRKLDEGKTEREVLRALKTYVLRELYTVMLHAAAKPKHLGQARLAA
jgi:transposase